MIKFTGENGDNARGKWKIFMWLEEKMMEIEKEQENMYDGILVAPFPIHRYDQNDLIVIKLMMGIWLNALHISLGVAVLILLAKANLGK